MHGSAFLAHERADAALMRHDFVAERIAITDEYLRRGQMDADLFDGRRAFDDGFAKGESHDEMRPGSGEFDGSIMRETCENDAIAWLHFWRHGLRVGHIEKTRGNAFEATVDNFDGRAEPLSALKGAEAEE